MLTIIGGIHAREALSGAPWYSRELRLIECPAGVAPLASENTHYRKQPHDHWSRNLSPRPLSGRISPTFRSRSIEPILMTGKGKKISVNPLSALETSATTRSIQVSTPATKGSCTNPRFGRAASPHSS